MEKTIQKSQCVLSNELPRLYVLPTGRWRHVLQCFFFFFSSTSVEVLLVWMLLKKKMTVKMDVSRSRSFLSVTSTDEDRARETCQGAISAALFTHGHDSSSKGLG